MVIKTEKDLMKVPIASKRKLLTCLLTGFTLISVATVLVFVNPVPWIVKWNMKVKEGSPVHEYLKKEQVEGVIISAYLFNITNAESFMSGEDHKLKVEEIGPFSYKELRTNEDLELDEEAGEIRYSPRIDMVFQPEISIGNPEDIKITMPNLPVMGMAAQISTYPYITRMAFNLLLIQLQSSPVVTMTAQKYMWGYQDPLVTLGNNLAPGIINFNKIGFLDRFYIKSPRNRLVVSAKDEDKFMIKSRNGHKKLNMGNGDPDECVQCDTFQDTYEGILYPLPITPKSKLRMFKEGVCKVWDMVYNETRIMDDGAEGLVFNLSDSFYNMGSNDTYSGLADFSTCFFGNHYWRLNGFANVIAFGACLTNNRCIRDFSEQITKSRVHNLSGLKTKIIQAATDLRNLEFRRDSVGIPVSFSKGHLLDVNPELYERIDGLKPDANKHNSYVIVETMMGIEVATYFVVQFNLVLGDLSYNSKTSKFSNMVLPVGNIYIVQPELTEENKGFIRLVYTISPIIMLCIKLTLFLISVVMIGYSIRLLYWQYNCREIYLESEQMKSCVEEPLMGNGKS